MPAPADLAPGDGLVQGFTPDGSAVLFTSPRDAVHTTRYTAALHGAGRGRARSRPCRSRTRTAPRTRRTAAGSPTTRTAPRYLQWKRYRGGAVSRVWIYDVATHAIEKVPQPAARATTPTPMWIGDTVYFRSDRDGEFNLYAYDPKDRRRSRG